MLSSGQFSIDGEVADTKCLEYFTMLDEDEDTLVSFYDFLTPLMSTLPHEVAAMFTQDQRYRQESFNDLRIAFDQESKSVEG